MYILYYDNSKMVYIYLYNQMMYQWEDSQLSKQVIVIITLRLEKLYDYKHL